jgi:hypothetical protein
MKEEEKIIVSENSLPLTSEIRVDDREYLTEFLISETEITSKEALAKQKQIESETRQMLSGETFTIAGLKEEFEQFLSKIEKDYEPKFTLFLQRLGTLCKWTEEEMKKFRKPRIAPITIIELFYNRFPTGTLQYMHEHNRYVGYCIRRTKNYKLLNEDGIRKLERLIDEANTLMPQCEDYYEFRKRMFENFQVPFQIELFEGLV